MRRLLSVALVVCLFAVLSDTAQGCDRGRSGGGRSTYYMPYADSGVRVYSAQGGTFIAPESQRVESAYFDPSVTESRYLDPAPMERMVPVRMYYYPLREYPRFSDYQPNDNWN